MANTDKIIEKAEKIFKTDIRYLLKGGSWLGLSQVISMATAFGLSIIFANLLNPEVYGIYKYILSIVPLLSIPTLNGMDAAITRAVALGNEGTVLEGMKTKLRFGILSTSFGILLSIYYFINGNQTLGLSFLVISVLVPLWESFDIYNSLINGKKLFNIYAKYYSLTQIISFFIMFGSVMYSKNILFIISIYFISNTAIRIYFFHHVIKKLEPNTKTDLSSISYGKHLSLMDIIGTILGQIDKILIFHYLGAKELALYTIAIAPPEQLKGALKNIHTLALPKFASRKKEDVKSGLLNKSIILGSFILVITGIYILIAPHFFNLFFPKYLEAIKYSQVISLSIVGATLSMFLYTFLESHGQTKKLYQFNIGSNFINLIIVFLMIYYFGLWGAVLSRIIIRSFLLLYSIILVKKT
jgi:O-antigen/teichoic acid export membrane protein